MNKFISIAALSLCLIVAGCAGQPTAPAPITPSASASSAATRQPAKSGKIRYAQTDVESMRDIPILMALDAMRAQGYTVETTTIASLDLTTEVLARGNADIGISSNQTVWGVIPKGVNLRTIAQKFALTSVIMTKSEIKSCVELNGKSIAVPSISGATTALFEEFVNRNCPGTKLTFLAIPGASARAAALQSGTVDAAILDLEYLLDIQKRSPNGFRVLVSLAKTFPEAQFFGIAVNQSWAIKNPEIVKDFLRELVIATRQVIEHPDVLYSESTKRLKLDPTYAKELGDAYLAYGLWHPNLSMTKENVEVMIGFLLRLKAVPSGLKAEDVTDLSYLNAVLDELGRK